MLTCTRKGSHLFPFTLISHLVSIHQIFQGLIVRTLLLHYHCLAADHPLGSSLSTHCLQMSDESANVFARFRFESSSSKRTRDASNESNSDLTEPQPSPSPSVDAVRFNPIGVFDRQTCKRCKILKSVIAGTVAAAGDDMQSPSAVKKRREVALGADTTLPLQEAPASAPRSKWQERWHGICDACFAAAVKCTHHDEHLLRLLIVGHNPSDHAWQSTITCGARSCVHSGDCAHAHALTHTHSFVRSSMSPARRRLLVQQSDEPHVESRRRTPRAALLARYLASRHACGDAERDAVSLRRRLHVHRLGGARFCMR